MNVIEIKNGVQVNKEFDKVKVQGFFQTSEKCVGLQIFTKMPDKGTVFCSARRKHKSGSDTHKNKKRSVLSAWKS